MQARILAYIYRYRGAHGYSPTYGEVAEHVGRHKVTVFEHVKPFKIPGCRLVCGIRAAAARYGPASMPCNA